MNTQQAYINGFVKRANEYGFSEAEAVGMFKEATRWRDEMLAGNIGVFHPQEMGKNVFQPGSYFTEPIDSYLHGMTDEMGWKPSKGTRTHPDFQKEKEIRKYYTSVAEVEPEIYATLRKYKNINSNAADLIYEGQSARLNRIQDILRGQRENLRELRSKGNIPRGNAYEEALRKVRKNLSTPSPVSRRMEEIARKINEQTLRRSGTHAAESLPKGILKALMHSK